MAKEKNIQHFSNSRLEGAAILAFVPFFSVFGVHDFVLRRYWKGIIHITIIVFSYGPYYLVRSICGQGYNCYNASIPFMFLQYFGIAASYTWAIVEAAKILRLKDEVHVDSIAEGNSKMSMNTVLSNEPSVAHKKVNIDEGETLNGASISSNAAVGGNTNYFVAGRPSLETVAKMRRDKKQEKFSKLSIIFTMVPVALWVYCLIVSGGSTSEGDSGAIWWLIFMYYSSIGIPLAALSIAFGIMGLKTDLGWLSIISLLIKITMIIIIVSLMIVYL